MTHNVTVPPAPTAPGRDFVASLPIRHDSTAQVVGAGTASGKQLFDVLLDGQSICEPLLVWQDDADALVLDIKRAIATEKIIHDAPVRHDSVIETEQTDPDSWAVRLDGNVLGEWGALRADDIEAGLEERIAHAKLVAIETVELPVPAGATDTYVTWHVDTERFDALLAHLGDRAVDQRRHPGAHDRAFRSFRFDEAGTWVEVVLEFLSAPDHVAARPKAIA